jgi:hypothetical protein
MDPDTVSQAAHGNGLLPMLLSGLGAFGAGAMAIMAKWGPPWAPKAAKEQDSATAVQLGNLADLMREHRAESRTALERIDTKVDALAERIVRVETVQARGAGTQAERKRRLAKSP